MEQLFELITKLQFKVKLMLTRYADFVLRTAVTSFHVDIVLLTFECCMFNLYEMKTSHHHIKSLSVFSALQRLYRVLDFQIILYLLKYAFKMCNELIRNCTIISFSYKNITFYHDVKTVSFWISPRKQHQFINWFVVKMISKKQFDIHILRFKERD